MPSPQEVRDSNLAYLNERGFKPATWMNLPAEVGQPSEGLYAGGVLRPETEIANRLLCHVAVFGWGSAPPDFEQTLAGFISSNGLQSHMTQEEINIIQMAKSDATEQFSHMVGWRLENMWSLAWILGVASEPSATTGQLGEGPSDEVMGLFLPDFTVTAESLIAQGQTQSVEKVIQMEDLFYLAHNAVRSGQTGQTDVLPEGFDPIGDGGAIHERRHSLTWALTPAAAWDETDLST